MKNKNKGFTLIELLVVIAIIGILSSVVLASLNSARNKGADAAIKSSLNNMRAQAELYYDDSAGGNGSYGAIQAYGATACTGAAGEGLFSDTTIRNAVRNVMTTGGVTGVGCISTGSPTDKWAISAPLKNGGAYCIDSTGNATTTPTDTGEIGTGDPVCG